MNYDINGDIDQLLTNKNKEENINKFRRIYNLKANLFLAFSIGVAITSVALLIIIYNLEVLEPDIFTIFLGTLSIATIFQIIFGIYMFNKFKRLLKLEDLELVRSSVYMQNVDYNFLKINYKDHLIVVSKEIDVLKLYINNEEKDKVNLSVFNKIKLSTKLDGGIISLRFVVTFKTTKLKLFYDNELLKEKKYP